MSPRHTITRMSGRIRPHWALIASALAVASILFAAGAAAAAVPTGTVLCKTSEERCKAANRYGIGTTLEEGLKTGTTSTIETTYANISCTSSSLSGALIESGGVNHTVPVELSSVSFGGCNSTLTPEGLPWHGNISRSEAGATSLTLTDMKLHTTTSTIFGTVNCYYGGPVTFSFANGSPAELAVEKAELSLYKEASALCTEKRLWTATYSQAAPKPAYVEQPDVRTFLCSASESPCAVEHRYPAETTVTASLEGSAKFENETFYDTCGESTITASLKATGSLGEPVKATVTKYSFGSCTSAAQVIGLGSLNIFEFGDGTYRGDVTQPGMELKITKNFCCGLKTECLYVGPTNRQISEEEGITLRPGKPATIHFDVQLPRLPKSGCYPERLRADYTVSPSPIYVTYGEV